MAYPKKMKNGKWRVQVEGGIDPSTGERKRYVRIRDTQEEAEEAWMELKKKIKEDSFGDEDITIADHMKTWLKSKKINISPTTYKSYVTIVYKHIIPSIGNLPLMEAKPYHFRNYFANKLENGKLDGSGGLSTQSIRHQYNVLNNAFTQAIEDRIISFNPLDNVSIPGVIHEESKPFSKEEVGKIFKLLQDDDWLFPIIYITVFTGMREGEVAALKWKNVDFNNKIIKVRESAYREKGKGIQYKKPKTKTSKRDITITDEDIALLKEHRKQQIKDMKYMELDFDYGPTLEEANNKIEFLGKKIKHFEKNKPYNYRKKINDTQKEVDQLKEYIKKVEEFQKDFLVFPMEDGSRTDPSLIYKRFKRFLRENGLGDHDFHDLRHTNASLLHKAGEDIKIIQEKHGHASSATTSDIYVHLDEDDHRRAANNLKKFMKEDVN